MLRLGAPSRALSINRRDAWSMVNLVRQATNEYAYSRSFFRPLGVVCLCVFLYTELLGSSWDRPVLDGVRRAESHAGGFLRGQVRCGGSVRGD